MWLTSLAISLHFITLARIHQAMARTNHLDPTFRSYTEDQAAAYAQGRFTYAKELYETIVNFHTKTGGTCGTVLDVGCGPGVATRDIAKYFDYALGADAGTEMINQARKLNGKSKAGNDIKYVIAPSEEVGEGEGIPPGTIDMITSATAVHWFRMDEFWANAKKLLRIGGTVALWTHASFYIHPSTPHADELQKILSDMEDNVLQPYEQPGNKLSRQMYRPLVLPWHVNPPVLGFEEANGNFRRIEWNADGKVELGEDFLRGREATPMQIGRVLETTSMATRWREAHPDIANTDRDPMKLLVDEMAGLLGSPDVKMKTGAATALLLLKRIEE